MAETIKVSLQKGANGLGVRVQSLEGVPGVSIVEIIPGGAADQQGELKAGDLLVAINGKDCKSAQHQAVIDLLTEKDVVEIEVSRPPAPVPGEIRKVVLKRGNAGLGIRIQSEEELPGVRIAEIIAGGPAEKVGGLVVGDIIVSVNGTHVLDKSHQEVIDQLVKKEEVVLEVKAPDDAPAGDVRYVNIVKGSSGLGLKISSGEGISGVQVTEITPGSVAESTGQVFVGDVIASVNDEDMRGASHDQVVAALTKSTEVKLGLIAGKLDESIAPLAPASEAPTDITDEGITDKRDVIIAREDTGFGLEIASLKDEGGVFVRKVVPDSPASKKEIKANDRILAVNGKPTSNATHDEVVALLTAEDEVELVVGKSTTGVDARLAAAFPEEEKESNTAVAAVAATAAAATAGVAAAAVATSEEKPTEEKPTEKVSEAIESAKEADTPKDADAAKEVAEATAAAATAAAANPISPAGKGSTPKPDGVRIVNLKKGDKGLGLKLTEFSETKGVFVEDIIPGTAAAESGQIFPGDHVVSVNGENTENEDFEKVVSLLTAKPEVIMGVKSSGDSATLGVAVQREYTNAPPDSTTKPADVTADVKKVHLKKGPDGYGMKITSYDELAYPVISEILPKGVAKDTPLAAGDSIVSINGQDLASKSYDDAIKLLTENQEIDLVATPNAPVSVTPADSNGATAAAAVAGAAAAAGTAAAAGSSNSRVVHLTNSGKGFGMRIASIEGHPEIEGIHVTEVLPNGPAADSKQVFKNDRIVAVNGKDLRNASNDEVLKELTSNKEIDIELESEEKINVAQLVSEDTPVLEPSTKAASKSEESKRTVHLVNTGKGFGMKIATVAGLDGVHVTEVIPGGPADESKQVFPNDQIVSVNGTDLRNATHDEVISKLTSNKEIDVELEKAKVDVAGIVANEGEGEGEGAAAADTNDKKSSPRIVHLANTGKGFGMKIATVEGIPGVHVSEVLPNGPAAASGRIFTNDKIVSVNGNDLRDASHDDVIKVFIANKEIDLELEENDVDVAAIVEKEGANNAPAAAATAVTASGEAKRVVHLKNEGQGFGMKIATVEGLEGIHVTEVIPDRPAAESKQVFVNDRIISVNGQDLRNATHDNVITALTSNKEIDLEVQKTDVDVAAIVENEGAAGAFPRSASSVAKVSGVRKVHLVKGKNGYGLRLASNASEDLHVSEVLPGGAAAENGQIYPNDKILSINGEDLTHASHETAISKLVESNEVDLELLHAAEGPESEGTAAGAAATPRDGAQPRRVHLVKGGGGYGMEVSKIRDHEGFHITKVISGGVADSSKEVFVNDLIVAINDTPITNKTHEEVIGMLVNGNEVDLDLKKDEHVDAVALVRKSAPTRKVKLSKAATGFGMKIATLEGLDGVHVVEVIEGGAAAGSGEVYPNDKILAINGTDVRKEEATKVLSLLSESKDVELELQANEDVDVVAAVGDQPAKGATADKRVVNLKRSANGYGMKIATIEGVEGVHVTEVIDGGVAAKSGQVYPNDVILSVNGTDTTGADSDKVVSLLSAPEIEVELAKSKNVDAVALTQGAPVMNTTARSAPIVAKSAPVVEPAPAEPKKPEAEIRKVHLAKGPDGYGLRLASVEGHDGVYIIETIEGGAADATGELKPNDLIVAIDGKDLRNASHKDVIEALTKSSEVYMEVQQNDEVDVTKLNDIQSYTTTLKRGPEGLGLRICTDAVENTIRVFEVIPGGAAAVDGKISVGDQILAVNGTDTVEADHENTVKLISASEEVKLVLCPNSNPLPNVEEEMSLRKVTLKTPEEGGLGIRLMSQSNGATIVLGVVEGSPADLSKEIHKGDQVVKVNNEALGADYDSIVKAFNAPPNTEVELLIADATAASTQLAKNVAAQGEAPVQSEIQEAPSEIQEAEEKKEDEKEEKKEEEKATEVVQRSAPVVAAAPAQPVADDTRMVTVERGPEGLGMTVASFDVVEGYAEVNDVFQGKPAYGKLQPGDQLLEINGTKLDGLKHAELLDLLRADKILNFRVRSGDGSAPAGLTSAPAGSTSASAVPTVRRAVLKKAPGQSLGMKIIADSGEPGVKILEVLPGGAAEASGKIFAGDKILEVNGQDVRNAYHDDVVVALKTNKDEIVLVLEGVEAAQAAPVTAGTSAAPRAAAVSEAKGVRQVELTRGDKGLGLTIVSDENMPGVRVQNVLPNSPASEAKKVFSNDVLVAINGVRTYNMLHADVLDQLKGKPKVSLVLAQPEDLDEAIRSLGEDNTRTVTLSRKGNESLGLVVAADDSGAVRVLSVSADSVAAKSGKIKAGDEISVVNSNPVSGKSHEDVVNLFSANKDVNIILRDNETAVPVVDSSTVMTGTGDIRTVSINPSETGLGIRIETDEGDNGAKVSAVLDGGAAAKSGKVFPGDHILAVGGVPMHDKPHHDIVAALGKPADEVTLLLRGSTQEPDQSDNQSSSEQTNGEPTLEDAERAMAKALSGNDDAPAPISIRPAAQPSSTKPSNEMELNEVRTAVIQRAGKSLGFKVAEKDGNHVILDITKGGPAEAAGNVFVNDIIVSVNGQTMRRKTHNECVAALTSSDECKLVLKQPEAEEKKKKKKGLFSCCC